MSLRSAATFAVSLVTMPLVTMPLVTMPFATMPFATMPLVTMSFLVAGPLVTDLTSAPPEGFTPLFNGKDLSGWHGMGHFDPRKLAAMSADERKLKRETDLKDMRAHWSVDGDEIVNDGHGVYLTTDREYGDIEFLIDYKTVAKADSGIYLRANPQVQIWDYTKEGGKWHYGANKGSGGLWNNTNPHGKDPLVLADKPFGEWNSFRILQVGDRTTVHLNGKLVVDHAALENFWDRSVPLWRQGPIQLQTHGGEIRWRNLYIREIDEVEANQILGAKDNELYTPIFNGKDLAGWGGAIDNYEVRDGAIYGKEGKGGNLYTADEYADFAVRFEFQLPQKGNNGLAIRYQPFLHGEPTSRHRSPDTAYTAGLCELQVLDTETYEGLKDYQVHGSAYHMAPAHRGFLRPTGHWNYQEVTVEGTKIRVELNGTTILDTKLNDLNLSDKDRRQHALFLKYGRFGFAGHGSPVGFRNIRIRRIYD